MIVVTAAQMREIDRRATEEFDIPGEVLMERAGSGVASSVRRMAEMSGLSGPVIHLIAGRGQNGGDAFVAARILKECGFDVEVWVAAHINQISGDALVHFGRMKAAGIEPYEITTMQEWSQMVEHPLMAEIIVDGVLGTGLKGPPRGPAAGAIRYIRSQLQDTLVVSIDVPSGLNADTGEAEGESVIADVTATIALPKNGLIEQKARNYVGSLDVVDIGIPDEIIKDVVPKRPIELIHVTDVRSFIARRSRMSHKGSFGHVLIVAGSRNYGGAAMLCGRAALRSGAGRVTLLLPGSLQNAALAYAPELIVWPGAENDKGALHASNTKSVLDEMASFDAIVLGPGLTVCDDTRELVESIMKHAAVPVVLDADAINMFRRKVERLKKSKAPSLVLTPHPGELARLIEISSDEVQKDRLAALDLAVKKTSAVVVLKGSGTLVASPDGQTHINMNGNPGMATAGSGDVLAGIIGGLLAQHLQPFDAARTGVFIHGRTGDYGALRRSQASLVAGDIVEDLAYVFRDLSLR